MKIEPNYEITVNPIVDELKKRRKEKGVTALDLSRRSGVSQTTIHSLEIGISNGTLSTIQRLANALDLELVLRRRHR
jgi:predicted transcriptional regulator